MADTLLQASKTSSLMRALSGSQDMKKWSGKIGASDPTSGREQVVVPLASDPSNTTRVVNTTEIPKIGFCQGAMLRLTYSGAFADGTTARLFCARYPGIAAVESVRLLSNSREICAMTGRDILAKIKGMASAGARDLMLRLAGDGIDDAAYLAPSSSKTGDPLKIHKDQPVKRDIVLYCPIPMSFFMGGKNYGAALDTAFLESLSLQTTLVPQSEVFQLIKGATVSGAGTTASPHVPHGSAPTAVKAALVFDFVQLGDKERSAAIKARYPAGGNLQVLTTHYELAGSETKPTSAITSDAGFTAQTFNIRTTASGIVRKVHVYVTRDTDPTKVGSSAAGAIFSKGQLRTDLVDESITRVRFSAGGRSLIDASPEQALAFAAGSKYGSMNRTLAGTTAKNVVSHFCWSFCEDDDESRYSGGAAFSGLSSQTWTVDADLARVESTTDYAVNHTCYVVLEVIRVVSFNSADGSCRVALSS